MGVHAVAATTTAETATEEEEEGDQVCAWSDEHGQSICADVVVNEKDDDEGEETEEEEVEGDDEEEEEEEEGKSQKRRRKSSSSYLPTPDGGREYFDEDGEDYDVHGYEEEEEEAEEDDEEDAELDTEEQEEEYDYDVWVQGEKYDLYAELKCPDWNGEAAEETVYADTSVEQIHTEDTWKTFNTIYNQILQDSDTEQQISSIPTGGFTHNGFQFKTDIKFDPKVGRGVYAGEAIPAGALLYVSTNTATFYEGQTFRNFLHALPRKLACDVMIWSYVRLVSAESYQHDGIGQHMVCTDLDEGSFVNTADSMDDYNMALGNADGTVISGTAHYQQLMVETQNKVAETLWYGCDMKFYALRDIPEGEELRAEYGDFVETMGWQYLGL